MLRDSGLVHVHRAVCLPTPIFSFGGTYYAYPERDGQAELTWLAGCIPKGFRLARLMTELMNG